MEEEIKKLQAELEALKETLKSKDTELSDKATEVTTLTTEKDALTTELAEKNTALAEYQKKEVLETRKAALAEAGITLELKPERIVKMDDAEFAEYVEDLKAAVATVKKDTKEDKKILASRNVTRLPKFESSNDTPVSAADLKGRLRTYSRSNTSEEDTE